MKVANSFLLAAGLLLVGAAAMLLRARALVSGLNRGKYEGEAKRARQYSRWFTVAAAVLGVIGLLARLAIAQS
jgi:hypothetical protein